MAQRESTERNYRTSRGLIHVRSHCSPDFVDSLEVDSGFGAIVPADRVKQTLQNIATLPDSNVIVAFVDSYRLVGFILIAKPAPIVWQGRTYHRRWEKCDVIYELGSIEVSKNYRELGIAGKMVGILGSDDLEDQIIIAVELSWHWDFNSSAMDKWQYRNMMVDLLSAGGFTELRTDDPEVTYDPANVLMARIGSRVSAKDVSQFHSLLFESDGSEFE